jgi:hypothetical protein
MSRGSTVASFEHPVVEARRRLDHALGHCEALDNEVRMFMQRDPFAAIAENDRQQGRYVVRGKINERPPATVGLIAGDAVHNVRAALDNLFWAFALRYKDPPDNPRISFPIFKDRTRPKGPCWVNQGTNLLRSVARNVGQVVESVQPFIRTQADPSRDPLWVLDRLWNDDKHRRIVPVAGAVSGYDLKGPFTIRGGSEIGFGHDGPFEDGDELASFRYNPAYEIEGNPNFEFTAYVAFPEQGPARGSPIPTLLHDLLNYVRDDVLPRFEGL